MLNNVMRCGRFDQEIVGEVLWRPKFRNAEIAVPTRYFKEASSASFGQSVIYGLKILWLVTYLFFRLGWFARGGFKPFAVAINPWRRIGPVRDLPKSITFCYHRQPWQIILLTCFPAEGGLSDGVSSVKHHVRGAHEARVESRDTTGAPTARPLMARQNSGFHMQLTVIIPALNEAGNLAGLLPGVRDMASRLTKEYELIVVDGGSPGCNRRRGRRKQGAASGAAKPNPATEAR